MNYIFIFLNSVWHLLLEMSPYLLLGFFLGGILYAFLPPGWVARYIGGESLGAVIRASLVGVPLPLCSCGVLPVAASARESGAGKAPTLAFLISTPVTGIDAIIATAGVLGVIFTIARILVSFFLALIAGIISIFIPLSNSDPEPSKSQCELCEVNPGAKSFSSRLKKAFLYAFSELPESLFNSMVLGLLVGGLISALMPEHFISHYLSKGIWGILTAVLMGIPLYVCATGSIPIAAAMMLKGFSPGAALAFLIAGPATNAVAITTVKKILGTRSLIIYLLTIFIGAIAFAMLFDLLPISFQVKTALKPHLMKHHSIFYQSCAYLLILLLAIAKLKQWRNSWRFKKAEQKQEVRQLILIKVPDMTCAHCEQTIKNALSKLEQLESITIDLKSKKLAITTKTEIDPQKILELIKSLGYKPELIPKS